jgi:hypothetical protein
MPRLVIVLMRLAGMCAAVAALAACASGRDDELVVRDAVPAETAERFRSEAEVHGMVDAAKGCEVTTSGEMLSAARSKQDATGAPIDGWLVESPRDTRVYRCSYDGQFSRNADRVAVWEAADADGGGPRPALSFQSR